MLDFKCRVIHMGDIEKIDRQIETVPAQELAQFRAWFVEFDWAAWDPQLEADIRAGKLDQFIENARGDHAKGKTTPLWPTTLRRVSGPRIEASHQRFNGLLIKPSSGSSR